MPVSLTRRQLLAGTAALTLGPRPAQAAGVADVIHSGGPVLTMEDASPRAEAVAIRDGRIQAVGRAADMTQYQDRPPN